MRGSLIAGCVASAFALFPIASLPRSAAAADLDGDQYAEPYDDGSNGAYDSGEYNDRSDYDRRADTYSERDDDGRDERLPGSVKDGYPVPVAPPRQAEYPRYREAPVEPRERFACLDRWQIRHRLRDGGWRAIRPMGGDGEVVQIRARRFDSSSEFKLRVDRCTGDVLAARPFYLRSFAYGERPWDYRY